MVDLVHGRRATAGLALGALAAVVPLAIAGNATNTKRHEPRLAAAHAQVSAQTALARLPLSFQPAAGAPGRFVANGPGYSIGLSRRGSVLALTSGEKRAALVRTALAGARGVAPRPESRLPGVANIYRGTRSHWRRNVPTFARVRYRGVYHGIDAVFHGRRGRLEYDFQVAPHADPGQIGLALTGARGLAVAPNGDLVVRVAGAALRQKRPVAYQGHTRVAAGYRLSHGRVSFTLGRYDHSRPLVIDPVLSYSSYLGGSHADVPTSIALGSDGSVYVAGTTASDDFPAATARDSFRSDNDAFVSKVNAGGASIAWTAQIGGVLAKSGTADDNGTAIAVDNGNGVALVGSTLSSDFPESNTGNNREPLDPDECGDASKSAFLVRFGSTGGLGYASCFGGGGSDVATGVAVRYKAGAGTTPSTTDIVVSGNTTSTDFSQVNTATDSAAKAGFQTTNAGGQDGFVIDAIFKTGGTASYCTSSGFPGGPYHHCAFLGYSTYVGGTSQDSADVVTVDPSTTGGPYAYFSGLTYSSGLDTGGTGTGSADTTNGNADVGKLDLSQAGSGSKLFLHYYGGNGTDTPHGIALTTKYLYVVGDTTSTNLPLPTGGNLVEGSGQDGFIGDFNIGGTGNGGVVSSTYVGGTGTDTLNSIAVQETATDIAQYVIGTTTSGFDTDFQQHNAITTSSGSSCVAGNTQVLIVKRIEGAGTPGAVISCLGGAGPDLGTGIAVPSSPTDGRMFITGVSGSFPLAGTGGQPGYGGGTTDGFVGLVTQTPPTITGGPADGAIVGSSSTQFTYTTSESDMKFGCSTPQAGLLVAGHRGTTNCPANGTASYSGLADGTHTFEVTTLDPFGSESAPTARTFTVDTTPPTAFDLVAPADGDSPGNQPTFSWGESTDASPVSYTLLVSGQAPQAVPSSACSAGVCSAQAASPILGGSHTWSVLATDGATPANSTSSPTRSFSVVDPPVARFTIAPNPVLVGKTATFDASASADATHAITDYQWDLDGNGSFETDSGTSPTTTHSYASPGTVSVGLQVSVATGETATSTQDVKVTDPTGVANQIGVSIDKGAQYTNDPKVTLTIVAPASTTQLLISNDGGFAGALPIPLKGEVDWKLDSSGPERLPKTVYVRFLSGPFASPNYTDDIILDERPPVVDSASVATPASASRAATAAKLHKYKVKVKAHDTNSGVKGVQVAVSKKKAGKLLKYKKSLSVKLGSRPKFIRAKDRAGNYSHWKKLR